MTNSPERGITSPEGPVEEVAFHLASLDLYRPTTEPVAVGGAGRCKTYRQRAASDLFEASVRLVEEGPDGTHRYDVTAILEPSVDQRARCDCQIVSGDGSVVSEVELPVCLHGRADFGVPATHLAPRLRVRVVTKPEVPRAGETSTLGENANPRAATLLDELVCDLAAVGAAGSEDAQRTEGCSAASNESTVRSASGLVEASYRLRAGGLQGSLRFRVVVRLYGEFGRPIGCECDVVGDEGEILRTFSVPLRRSRAAEVTVPDGIDDPRLNVRVHGASAALQRAQRAAPAAQPEQATDHLSLNQLQVYYLRDLLDRGELFAARCFAQSMDAYLQTQPVVVDPELTLVERALDVSIPTDADAPQSTTWPPGLIGILYYNRAGYHWALLAIPFSATDDPAAMSQQIYVLDRGPQQPVVMGTRVDGLGARAAQWLLWDHGTDGFLQLTHCVSGYNGDRIHENSASAAQLASMLSYALDRRNPPAFVVGQVEALEGGRSFRIVGVDEAHLEKKLEQVPEWCSQVIVPKANREKIRSLPIGKKLESEKRLVFVESCSELTKALWGRDPLAEGAQPVTLSAALRGRVDEAGESDLTQPGPAASASADGVSAVEHSGAVAGAPVFLRRLVWLATAFAVAVGIEVPLFQEYLPSIQFHPGERGPLWHGVLAAVACAAGLGALTFTASRKLLAQALAGRFVRFHRVWVAAVVSWIAVMLAASAPVWGTADTGVGPRWFQVSKAAFFLASELVLTVLAPMVHLGVIEYYRRKKRLFAVRTMQGNLSSTFGSWIAPFVRSNEIAVLSILCVIGLAVLQWIQYDKNPDPWHKFHIVLQALIMIAVAACAVVLLGLSERRVAASVRAKRG